MDATVCRVHRTWRSGVFRGASQRNWPHKSPEDSDERPTFSDFSAPGHWPCRQFSDKPNPASTPGPGEPTLAEVRRLTERFPDVNVALAEGYIRDPFDMCATAEMMGRPAALDAMGIHFFRPDLLGITRPRSPRVSGTGTHTDFRQRSILIYEPKADGSLELVAVEKPGICRRVACGGTHRTADVLWRAVRRDGRRPSRVSWTSSTAQRLQI